MGPIPVPTLCLRKIRGSSAMTDPVLVDIDRSGVAIVSLNRPAVNNAYDGALIEALAAGLERLAARPGLRLVVLRGNGRHFQAGADLAFLRRLSAAPADENLAFSRATVAAIHALHTFPCPTLALVHGGCFGGGAGRGAVYRGPILRLPPAAPLRMRMVGPDQSSALATPPLIPTRPRNPPHPQLTPQPN